MATDDTAAALTGALERFNRGDYFGSQELFEQVYAESAPGDQPLLRGLLMLASGMHLHFHRGGGRGAINLFRSCLLALDEFRPQHLGIDVEELYRALEAYIDDVTERRKPGVGFLDRWLAPRIRSVRG